MDMWEGLPRLLEQAESDDKVRLVVFSGAGDKSFISGADISQFEDLRAAKEAVKQYEQTAERALQGIYEFANAHDCVHPWVLHRRRIERRDQLRHSHRIDWFGVFIPASRLGLGYRFSAMQNLTNLVGPGFAKDIFFTGRRLDAEEALRIGLVNRVAEASKLDALLEEYTSAIKTGAPLTIRAGKRILREVLETG